MAYITLQPVADTLTGDEALLISQLSSTVTISAATISATASDNSFNDSGSGFVTAGFAVGDRVNVSGFTGDTANNIYAGVLTSVAAGKIIVGGTDGDVIVDDAAGETVTITKWESRRATAQEIANLAAGASTYILPLFFTTTPTDGEVLLLHKAGAAFTITADFTAALESHVGTNPTATFDLTVAQDGMTIGTISVSTGGVVTATTTSGTAKAIAQGDLITITGPGTADTTAANMAFTIIGER